MVSTPHQLSGAIDIGHISTDGWPEWMVKILDSVPPEARGEVEEFIGELQLQDTSVKTQSRYLIAIDKLPHNGHAFGELTEHDVIEWVRELPKRRQKNGRRYSKCTLELTKRLCRRFLRWCHTGELRYNPHAPYPKVCKRIHVEQSRANLRKTILSEGDVRKLVDATERQRDRAMVFVCYESGTRIGELLSMRLRDVEFDRHGAVIIVNGKTGSRRIRLVQSVPDLQLWLNMHPHRDDPDAPVWLSRNGNKKAIVKQRFQELLKTLVKRSGLGKHVNPHLLRHSRATHLAGFMTEAQLREFFGWTKRSDQPAVYVHLSGRDVDSALLKHYGITEEEEAKKAEELKSVECHRCGFKNPPGAKFCAKCSMALNSRAALTLEKGLKRASEAEAKVIKWFIDKVPELLRRAADETGAAEEIPKIAQGEG